MSASAPKVSSEQKAAQAAQADSLAQQAAILKEQYSTQQLLAPYLYKSLGLTPKMDKTGKIIGFSDSTDPNQLMQKKITGELLQRQQDALEGKLPVDPNLNTELDRQEALLHESLSKQLGPGYATSTPGIYSLQQFNKNKANLLSSASRGDLSFAEQLALAQQGSVSGQQQQTLAGVLGVGSGGLNSAAGFGSVAGGYGNSVAQYQQALRDKFQMDQSGGQGFAALLAGLGKLGGQLALAPTTSGGSLFGDLF